MRSGTLPFRMPDALARHIACGQAEGGDIVDHQAATSMSRTPLHPSSNRW